MSLSTRALSTLRAHSTAAGFVSQLAELRADVARHALDTHLLEAFAQIGKLRADDANSEGASDSVQEVASEGASGIDGGESGGESEKSGKSAAFGRGELIVIPAAATVDDADGLALTDVKSVLAQCAHFDNAAPISERFERGLAEVDLGHWLFMFRDSQTDSIIAVAALDPATYEVEAAVVPEERDRGWGQLMGLIVSGVVDHLASSQPDAHVNWWSHGDHPAARHLAQQWEGQLTRELLVMEVPTRGDSATQTAADKLAQAGFELLSYPDAAAKWGSDYVDEQWLRVNNRAFNWHPEQGGWTQEDLDRGRQTQWYDASGVLTLWRDNAGAADENANNRRAQGSQQDASAPSMVGFHWTKQPHLEQGEVYVIGIDPAAQGHGLGKHLTQAGVDLMHERGAQAVELYVEADNTAAVKAYERLGFAVAQRHCTWTFSW